MAKAMPEVMPKSLPKVVPKVPPKVVPKVCPKPHRTRRNKRPFAQNQNELLDYVGPALFFRVPLLFVVTADVLQSSTLFPKRCQTIHRSFIKKLAQGVYQTRLSREHALNRAIFDVQHIQI